MDSYIFMREHKYLYRKTLFISDRISTCEYYFANPTNIFAQVYSWVTKNAYIVNFNEYSFIARHFK